MRYKIGDKVKIKIWFTFKTGTITDIENGLYTISCEGMSYHKAENEIDNN